MPELKACGHDEVNGTEVPVLLAKADGEDRIDSFEYQLYKSESGTKHLYVAIGDDAFVLDPDSSKKFLDQAIECGRVILICQYVNLTEQFYREIGTKPSPENDDEATIIKDIVELPPKTIQWFKKMRNMMRYGGDGSGGTSAAD